MEKNNAERVNETLNSLQGIERAEANVYLFEKIKHRMQEELFTPSRFSWSWMAMVVLLVGINAGAVVYSVKSPGTSTKEKAYAGLEAELGLNNGYNY